MGTSSGAVERPLSRPTNIPVGSGVQCDQSPRGQVERARGLRPSDSLWCHRGPRQRALFLMCAPFLAVSFPFYGGWLDFVFCHRLPVRPYRLTAITSGFPRLPTLLLKETPGMLVRVTKNSVLSENRGTVYIGGRNGAAALPSLPHSMSLHPTPHVRIVYILNSMARVSCASVCL